MNTLLASLSLPLAATPPTGDLTPSAALAVVAAVLLLAGGIILRRHRR